MAKKTRKEKLSDGRSELEELLEEVERNSRYTSKGIFFWGIDPSLSRTGIVVLDCDGECHEVLSVERQHRPEKKKVTRTRYQQCHFMAQVVTGLMKKFPPLLVVSESYAYAARNITPVAEFNGVWQYVLLFRGQVPRLHAAPAQLRKFLFGKGSGQDKDYVSTYVLKNFGVECKNSDEADAFALARISLGLYWYLSQQEDKLTSPQLQVVEAIIAEKYSTAKEW